MKMTIVIAATLAATAALPAAASEFTQFPAPMPSAFPRSYRTGQLVIIPPYDRPFVVRTYTTPPQQPFYNVPPFSVVAPY